MPRFVPLAPAAGALLLMAGIGPAQATSRAEIDRLVTMHAAAHRVPEALVHRVIRRESTYNARAVSRGNFGLMQIRHGTAQGLGYRGPTSGLLDADTNLRYGIAYLAGAYQVADGNHDRAVALYSRGYYYEAKRRGLTGRQIARSAPARETAQVETVERAEVTLPQPEAPSWLATLFGVQAAPPDAPQEPASLLQVGGSGDEPAQEPAPRVKARPRQGTTRVARQERRPTLPVKLGAADAPSQTDARR